MLRKKTLLLCSTLLFLSGCEMFNTPLNTLQPPKLTEEQENIKQDILKQLPENSKIADPFRTGGSLPLYNMVDLDGDNKEEVIVFHIPSSKPELYTASIFKEVEHTWTIIDTLDIAAEIIDTVTFKDVTNDGHTDILIGIGENAKEKNLAVYQLVNSAIHSVLNTTYEQLIVEDLDGDGKNELYTLSAESKEKKHTEKRRKKTLFMNKYTFTDNSLSIGQQLPVHTTRNSFYFFESGVLTPNKKGLVLHSYQYNEASYKINIYHEENGQLVSVQHPALEQLQHVSLSVNLKDINNDGISEFAVPMIKNEQVTEQPPLSQLPFITGYYQWDGIKEFYLLERHYHDNNLLYDLTIPAEWPLDIRVTKKDNLVVFTNEGTNKVIFDIQAIPIEKWNNTSKQFVLKQTDSHVFVSNFQTEAYTNLFKIKE